MAYHFGPKKRYDGEPDTTLNILSKSGYLNNYPTKPLITSDGKIYIAGKFTAWGSTTANRIIRFNPDGSIDTSFNTGTGFNSNVNRMVIDSNNKIYCIGAFTTYQGVAANRIIRLNPDGSKDGGFDNTTGFSNGVEDIVISPDGNLIVCCPPFCQYKGVSSNGIIKLNTDGTKDTSFNNSTGFNNTVDSITVDRNGKIYASGYFTSYKSVSANGIVGINPDGSRNTDFNVGTGFNLFGAYQTSENIKISPDNSYVIVSSKFTTYNGVSSPRIIKINTATGAKDTSFNPGTGFDAGFYPGLGGIDIDYQNRIYVCNTCSSYNGVSKTYVYRILPDGSLDTSWPDILNNGASDYGTGVTIWGNFAIYTGYMNTLTTGYNFAGVLKLYI